MRSHADTRPRAMAIPPILGVGATWNFWTPTDESLENVPCHFFVMTRTIAANADMIPGISDSILKLSIVLIAYYNGKRNIIYRYYEKQKPELPAFRSSGKLTAYCI
jgi:hypothetical protein